MEAFKGFDFSLEIEATEESEEEKIERKNMIKKSLKSACINSNIPDRYSEKGFSCYEETTAGRQRFKNDMQNIYSRINNGETINAVLCGTFGIGKTHLSCAILRALLQSKSISYGPELPPYYNNNLCHYVRADEIRQEMTDAKKFSNNINQTEIIDKYSKYKVLVIDEVGGTHDEKTEKDLLYQLLHNRYENNTSTILITNKNFSELCSFLGGAITDRLREKSLIVDCSGMDSYRGNK